MAGTRKPIELLKATGRKHLTQAEIAERDRAEVKTPVQKQVRAPGWLPDELRPEFNDLSRQLVALKIFSKLDRDTLARYLLAHQVYVRALNFVQAAISSGDAKEAEHWSCVQNKYFKQCRECANDLGLTISSRCKLVVPDGEKPAEENPFLALIHEREERSNHA